MTVHLAKGLEFPCVFMTGMEEGLFPLGEADFSQEELEEERRLCYVGMTRAKRLLGLTWAASRKLFGHSRWNAPSRFIQEAGLAATHPAANVLHPASETTTAARDAEAAPPTDPGLRSPDAGLWTQFRVGLRVRHPEFGEGKITEKSGTGDGVKVVVLFDSGQWKKLLVKFANLERA